MSAPPAAEKMFPEGATVVLVDGLDLPVGTLGRVTNVTLLGRVWVRWSDISLCETVHPAAHLRRLP